MAEWALSRPDNSQQDDVFSCFPCRHVFQRRRQEQHAFRKGFSAADAAAGLAASVVKYLCSFHTLPISRCPERKRRQF